MFLFCKVAVSPVRKEASDTSEMVTQILFGEVAEIIHQEEAWIQIKSLEDGYEGFVSNKQFVFINQQQLTQWKKDRYRLSFPSFIESKKGIIRLPIGCFLSKNGNFEIDDTLYLSQKEEKDIYNWQQFSMQFINTAYLWGGRTEWGIDCSGFTQQVLRFRKVELPRDASQQASLGNKVSFNNRKPGNLVFFQNEKGKIIHVGILLTEHKIIHASGHVRIDELTEKGIINIDTNAISHTFHSVRTYDPEFNY